MAVHSALTSSDLHEAKVTPTASAPGSTPTFVGQVYFDSTNSNLYVATATSSSSDWKQVAVNPTMVALTASGAVTFTGTTDSTTTGTGILVVSGGVGIAKAVNIGTTLSNAGAATLASSANNALTVGATSGASTAAHAIWGRSIAFNGDASNTGFAVTLDSKVASKYAYHAYKSNGGTAGIVGIAGTTNDVVTGSSNNDMVVSTPAGLLVGAGSTKIGGATSAGVWTFGPAASSAENLVVNGYVNALGYKGATSAVSASYIGEKVVANNNAGTTIVTASYTAVATTATLTAGIWALSGTLYFIGGAATTQALVQLLFNGTGGTDYGMDFTSVVFASAVNGQSISIPCGTKVVVSAGTGTAVIQAKATGGNATAYGHVIAIRVG